MPVKDLNIRNKRAKFEYHLMDTFIAGIQLKGTEIKSIRMGKASILEAYCICQSEEVFIRNMHVSEYANASFYHHKPRSDRKLLLNKRKFKRFPSFFRTKAIR